MCEKLHSYTSGRSGYYKLIIIMVLGSNPTERVTKLLNDIFGIFNSSRAATAVPKTNWDARKKKLETLFFLLNKTEKIYEEKSFKSPSLMFMSDTTMQG
jgi:hypothetical protein